MPKVLQNAEGEHSAILSTVIKLQIVIKIFVMSIFEYNNSQCTGENQSIINVQALYDRINHSVVWLKYNLNINKLGIFAIKFYFLHFIIVKNDHVTFSTVE